MLQQDTSSSDREREDLATGESTASSRVVSFDVQAELNRLEELILDRPRIPFTRRTIVDEEQLLDQLDLVRIHLPSAFEEALALLRQRDELVLQAEDYAREIVEAAQQQAAQLVDEVGIVRQAEVEATQLRQQVQQDCEEMQRRTLNEIEQMRVQALQEIEQMRQLALGECEDIQAGADKYADAVLTRIEQQLGDMLRVVRNGRSQLRSGGQVRAADANPPQ